MSASDDLHDVKRIRQELQAEAERLIKVWSASSSPAAEHVLDFARGLLDETNCSLYRAECAAQDVCDEIGQRQRAADRRWHEARVL